jgi:hypothetical protein
VSTPNRKFFTLNLEYDSFGFDFVMIHMLWLVNDFIEFGCYDMLCHVISYEQECNSVQFQFKKNDSVFIKTICSFKPVHARPNHGTILIRNDCVKTFFVRFPLILELEKLFDELDSDCN